MAAPDEERHRSLLASFFDRFANVEARWGRRNAAYHRLVERLVRLLVPPGARVLEIGSGGGRLLAALEPARGVGIDVSERMVELARARHPQLEFHAHLGESLELDEIFDYVVCSDLVPYAYDLVRLFKRVRACSHAETRIVIHSYSQLWRPVIRAAELLRLKKRKPLLNWVTPEDVRNCLDLAGFEAVSTTRRILFPKRVPVLATLVNAAGGIWPLSRLCLTWWVVARVRDAERRERTVSVVVPCRNEEGNVAALVERLPELGAGTEIVFVEGGSTDGTRAEIERAIVSHPERQISLHVQTGKGKGDAVRLGFAHAKHELLLILDGDLSVDPEELTTFYDALADGRADFVNGSRLVYAREPGSMQLLNVGANRFFSRLFTAIMDQHVKDTLCGTKGLRRSDWLLIDAGRAEFGLLDPFGDFDLLLGAARRGLKIVDVPVRYRARTYGRTNISRFRHGLLLLRMSIRAFYALRVRPVSL